MLSKFHKIHFRQKNLKHQQINKKKGICNYQQPLRLLSMWKVLVQEREWLSLNMSEISRSLLRNATTISPHVRKFTSLLFEESFSLMNFTSDFSSRTVVVSDDNAWDSWALMIDKSKIFISLTVGELKITHHVTNTLEQTSSSSSIQIDKYFNESNKSASRKSNLLKPQNS